MRTLLVQTLPALTSVVRKCTVPICVEQTFAEQTFAVPSDLKEVSFLVLA